MDEDDEVGADEIYLETAGEDDDDDDVSGDEVGAKKKRRKKAKTRSGRAAFRRIAFIPGTSVTAGSTVSLPVTLNSAFKGIGMRMAGVDVDQLLFGGATIRGVPQEASAGSVGCGAFAPGETFFWEWATASPGEAFTLSFTNPTADAIVPRGYLIGYMA